MKKAQSAPKVPECGVGINLFISIPPAGEKDFPSEAHKVSAWWIKSVWGPMRAQNLGFEIAVRGWLRHSSGSRFSATLYGTIEAYKALESYQSGFLGTNALWFELQDGGGLQPCETLPSFRAISKVAKRLTQKPRGKPRDLEAIFDELVGRLNQDEIDAVRAFAHLKL